jgi:hypothetical protein
VSVFVSFVPAPLGSAVQRRSRRRFEKEPQHSTAQHSVQSPRGSNPLLLLFFAMHEAHIGAHRDPFLHIIKIMLFQIDTKRKNGNGSLPL